MSGPFGSSQWMYASGGFYPKIISGSLRFNRTDEGYLSFTPASDGNRKTWTYSTWVKRSRINDSSTLLDASVSGGVYDILYFPSTNQFRYYNNGSQPGDRLTNEKFRDTSAWYHIVLAVDTTDSTAANRIKLYINGSQITSFGLTTNFDQNDDTRINSAVEHRIGQSIQGGVANLSFGGYMAETFFIDGTAHDADAFGETKNGIWVAKNITSSNFTMGTNGWHLTFEDDSTVEAFNTLLHQGNGGTQSITGAGFSPDFVWSKARSGDTVGGHLLFDSVRGATKYLQSNSTGAEATDTTMLTSFDSDGFTLGSSQYINDSGNEEYVAWCWDAGGTSQTATYVVKVVSDSGNKYRFDDFGTSAITLELSEGGTYRFDQSDSSNSGHPLRFSTTSNGTHGGGSEYTTGVTTNGTPGSAGAYTEITVASGAPTLYYYCTQHSGMGGQANTPSTKGYTNVKGTIQSKVLASDTTGHSIVSYVGTGANATVGHGLSAAPDWVLVKDRDNSNDWITWHSGLADGTQHLKLNNTEASSANATYWNSTAPSSSVISLGSNSKTNGSSQNFIAYCWTETTGVSKFGKYTGNASSTGPSVTLGFKPAFVMIKGIDRSSVWYMFDTTRQTTNDATNYTHKYLVASSSNTEYTNADDGKIEITSTGFQVRAGVTGMNASGEDYIYMAFADTREAAFWLDSSSNNNDWQHVRLDHNDTVNDSPTDNHATFNPEIIMMSNASNYRKIGDFSEGNLLLTTNADDESGTVPFGASSGKYYMELTSVTLGNRQQIMVFSRDDFRGNLGAVTTSSDGGGNATDRVTWTSGDVIGIAVDLDNSKVFFHKNGDYFGTSNPVTNTGGDTLTKLTGVGVRHDSGGTNTTTIRFNGGQQPFKYGPPE